MNSRTKTAALIVARLSSERIPRKNVLPLNGIPMIIRLVNRLRDSKYLDDIIVCTSEHSSDDELCKLCQENNISYGRGPLENVMERICSVASDHDVTTIVEILGDNPFIQSDLVDHGIEIFDSHVFDYVANYSNDYVQELNIPKFPIGIRVQVYSLQSALLYLDDTLKRRSHPSSFLYSNPERFNVKLFGAIDKFQNLNHPNYNISVNYKSNFEFANQIFKKFDGDVRISDVIDELESNESLMSMIKQS